MCLCEREMQLFHDTEKQIKQSSTTRFEAASVCADLQSCAVEVDRL